MNNPVPALKTFVGRSLAALLLMLCAGISETKAQSAPYKFDLGADLGMSGYIVDANRSNFMSHPGFAG